MKIKVATRFRPFSHTPGAACLIPGEKKIEQVWPSVSHITDLEGNILEVKEGAKTLFQELDRPYKPERLSLGNHKSQDFDGIRRRKDLKEILPLWFKLGSFYTSDAAVKPGSLLFELLNENDRNKLPELFLQTFLSGLDAYFVPRRVDSEKNGFHLPPLLDEPLLLLLSQGREAIKRMLFEENEGTLHVLPRLSSTFHHGRLIETPTSRGLLSIEWTKHFLRKVVFTAYSDEDCEEVDIRFPSDVKQYRVKASGKSFLFDNFKG